MKLKCEQLIKADRDTVWNFFDDPDNLRRWQPTLASFTPQSGIPGQRGAKAELVYDENGRRVVMTETITERRRPDFLAGTYDSRHGTTLVVNRFDALDEDRTRWTSWSNFRFRGVMKLMSPFIGGAIRRRTEADMRRFAELVEKEGNAR